MRFVARGNSPVEGEGKFRRLNKTYATDQKGGNRTPNLDLEGDMLDSLTHEITGDGIKVGIFRTSEVPKADGHNNFSGESKLPTRRFIPDASQDFKSSIKTGITRIIQGFEQNLQDEDPLGFLSLATVNLASVQTALDATDITIDDVTRDFLGGNFE